MARISNSEMNIIIALLMIVVSPVLCYAECVDESKVAAQSFMNEYIEYLNEMMSKKTTITMDQWVENNKTVTTRFKSSYKKIVDEAKKEDPELGLNADPILDAQDYPDKGTLLDRCDDNFVTLKGKEWERFKAVVKMIKTKNGWMVDGSGIINIPKDKQAPR